MHLEHLNLVVCDLQKTLAFYQAAFPHWRIRSQGESTCHEYKRKWLHFGDDYRYIASSDHGVESNRDLTSNHVGLAHYAYVTNNIKALISRLEAASYTWSRPIDSHGVKKNSYYIDPDCFEIEFVEYSSDLPNERNSD
tara:strand:+ start:17000 stop:17413 length:414 start_codon:yes stop_codon:yes gene_type:complete